MNASETFKVTRILLVTKDARMIEKYLESIEKSKCPPDCPFIGEDVPIIKIPPPENLKIILISRDPTTDFISLYKYAVLLDNERRRSILFTDAIPLSLIRQITKFLKKGDELTKEKEKTLFKLYDVAYWTHLHKCPTKRENNPFLKGSWKKATICADHWLQEEISTIKEAQLIVCLGRDVERWMDDVCTEITHIYLPHPSPRNNGIYSRKISKGREEKLGKNIDLLLVALWEACLNMA